MHRFADGRSDLQAQGVNGWGRFNGGMYKNMFDLCILIPFILVWYFAYKFHVL